MCSSSTLHILLTLLKQSSHNTNHLAQIFSQTITTGLITRTLAWNYVIRSYSKSSSPSKAIQIYNYYYSQGRGLIIPDNHTYPSLIKACSILNSLPKGRELHAHLTKVSFDLDGYVSNSFIHFYGSMCQVSDARKVFDEMSNRDLVSWNSVIACYGLHCNVMHDESLLLFKEMRVSGVEADGITLVMVLSACSHIGRIYYGRGIHGYVIKVGVGGGLNVRNALLNMYAKCCCVDEVTRLFYEGKGEIDIVSQTIMINGFLEVGLLDEARKVFDQMVVKDLFAWNSMINGYVKAMRPEDAIKQFEEMDKDMANPDENTLVSVLAACAMLSDLQLGRLLHQYILRRRINRDVVLGTALVNMYAKCGCLEQAMTTFFKMDYKDVFAWTAAITSLSFYGHGTEALNMLRKMENESVKPNEATFVSVLMACSRSGLVKEGCLLFDRMIGFYNIQPTVEHFGCLVDLLSRAGLLFVTEKMIERTAPEVKIVGYKTLLSAAMNYHDIKVGEKVAKKLINLKPHTREVFILVSNFYALADHWDKVAEIRQKMKDMNMIKEVGTSSVEEKA